MNLSEHIAKASKFQGKKPELTFAEAEKTATRSSASFGISLVKRLNEAKNTAKAEEKPGVRNPSVLSS
jgi:hypothetical protein